MKLNWRGKIVVNTKDEQAKRLIYRGELEKVDSVHLTCRMRGALHHEEFYIRIIYPIPSSLNTTYGLKVGEDFNHDIFSTIYLFSRDSLSSAAATARLRRKLEESTLAGLNGIVLRTTSVAAAAPGAATPKVDAKSP